MCPIRPIRALVPLLLFTALASGGAVSHRTETQRLDPSEPISAYAFGYARPVATFGDWAFAGNPGGNSGQGSVDVFEHTLEGWTLRSTLVSGDGAAVPNFGYAIAVEDRTLVVTSCNAALGGGAVSEGFAYVFRRAADGTWAREARLEDPGAAQNWFGRSVAIDGDTVVIGATHDYEGAGDGVAHVFRKVGATWNHEAALKAATPIDQSGFGWSVALTGDTLIVGELWAGAAGAAHVFVRSGTAWTLQQKLTSPGGPFSMVTTFGISVALEGDTAVVGAQNANGGIGAVYVYGRKKGVWTLEETLDSAIALNTPHTLFGRDVALHGDRLLVGATWLDPESTAFTYVRHGTSWHREAELVESNGAALGIGCTAVALGDGVAVTFDLDEGAYLYELPSLHPAAQKTHVKGVAGSPTFAPGNAFVLTGTAFGKTPGEVLVDGRPVTLLSWSDRTVKAVIPLGEHCLPVRLRTADGHAADAAYTYDGPMLTGLSKKTVRPGDPVTLRGGCFGASADAGKGWVEFGGDRIGSSSADLLAWTDRAVTVRTPATAGTYLVRVHTSAGETPPLEILLK